MVEKTTVQLDIPHSAEERVNRQDAWTRKMADDAVQERLEREIDRLHARIAELEAAGNRLGDAAIAGILNGNDFRARAERAEAELDISREAHRMVQSALLSQAAETERVEAERDALREALVIACAIVDAALAISRA